ncbi:unnamed protein product [Brugia pahangi]|uniref:SLC25A19 n=2 Tax=Brugia pahangi TaxID=6280 RepID=A0A0N4T954_BRUPA|nr:unnamed protein product [Brugia pahangi]
MLTIGYCSEHYDRKLERFGYFEPVLHYLIGVVAGAAGVLTGHPLDTVKIRQQTEAQRMSSPLISFTAIHAIAFGVYGNTIKLFDNYHNLLGSFIAGNIAGIAQCSICIPSDLVKIKLQLQV